MQNPPHIGGASPGNRPYDRLWLRTRGALGLSVPSYGGPNQHLPYVRGCNVKLRYTLIVTISIVGLLLAGSLLAQPHESLFGAWKMNPAKSKYSPGPIPKSNSAKWEASPGGVKLTVKVVPASGPAQRYESSGKFDGKDNPVKGNNPDGDTMA